MLPVCACDACCNVTVRESPVFSSQNTVALFSLRVLNSLIHLKQERQASDGRDADDVDNRRHQNNGNGGHGNGAEGEQKLDKQSFLSSGFTYSVRPPSPYPQHRLLHEEGG